MKKTLNILYAATKQSFIYELQYRLNFFINIIIDSGWTGISLLTVLIIGRNASIISDSWNTNELTLLFCFYSIATFFVSALFRRNSELIPNKILGGDLDFLIVKPINSKFLASVGYSRLGMIPSLLFLIYLSINSLVALQNGLPLIFNCLIMLFLIASVSIIEYSLLLIVMTLSFWLIGAYNLSYVYTQINLFGSYPVSAFGGMFQLIFTIVFPIAFVATIPAESLISLSLVKVLIVPIVAIITYKFSDILWSLGLRGYSSASS